jgi:hypothetical protein
LVENNKENLESQVTKETPQVNKIIIKLFMKETLSTFQSDATKQINKGDNPVTIIDSRPPADSSLIKQATSTDGISSFFSRRRNTSQFPDNYQTEKREPYIDTDSKAVLSNERKEQDLVVSNEPDVKSVIEEKTNIRTVTVINYYNVF